MTLITLKKLICVLSVFGITNVLGQSQEREEIRNKIRPTFNLTDCRVAGDTLVLVSSDDFLYYPFGKFDRAGKLKAQYPSLYNEKNEVCYLAQSGSYVKFFYDDEKKSMEIVFAKITSPSFKLINGAMPGMKKGAFFEIYFTTLPNALNHINVLTLESAVLGIWHYYRFEKDALSSFVFDTDYQMDKKY